jgi:acetylornithine deacetylase
MNAPATATTVRPELSAAPAHGLLAWDLIQKLVSFDTTSRDSNLALIDWIRGYLRGHGIESTLTFNDDQRKANLFATLPARDGNATTNGIVLSGHTDVVPVDGQPWDTNPFAATIDGDKVHGRGVTDMKSFSATGLAFVPEFLRRGLKRPVHFALSYDEEVGCIGVRRLIDDIVRRGLKPAGCIVGEPTGMQLVVAHKGKRSYRCMVRGHEAHSSLTPLGVNAVQIACEIVTFLTGMARRFRDDGAYDDAYDVPYTTVHTGVIHGGTALNIVPRDCWFDFEFRHLPFDDPDQLLAEVKTWAARFLPEMRAVAADTHIEFDQLSAMPGFDTHGGSEIADIGRQCSGTHDYGKVSFGTEASLFHNAAIPTIICGPGHIA